MIKQLQRKFVFSAMLAITVLLIVVLGAVNIFNTISENQKTDKLLSTLAEVENSAITMMLPEVRGSWNLFSQVVTQDDTLGAIYFVAREDVFGNLRTIDTSHIKSVDVKEAGEYVLEVRKKADESGRIGRFKYTVMPTVGNFGKTYIFLDVTKQVSSVWQVMFLSVLVGVLCWIAMLFLIILLSKRAIKPIAVNIEKQKQFVTDAGHEIKTPLAIIMANTDALELHYGENKYSKNIRGQIIRLKDLTQDLLSLAKMEESADVKVKTNFSITAVLEENLYQFEEALLAKGVLVHKNIQPNLNVNSNREQVERLISILLDNATKYVSQNGQLEIYLSLINKQVNFVVANTAENLQNLELDKLFDRFYRGDDARTQTSGGYGIGLSAAKTIVESLKGTISVQKQNENKIIFVVKLPLE